MTGNDDRLGELTSSAVRGAITGTDVAWLIRELRDARAEIAETKRLLTDMNCERDHWQFAYEEAVQRAEQAESDLRQAKAQHAIDENELVENTVKAHVQQMNVVGAELADARAENERLNEHMERQRKHYVLVEAELAAERAKVEELRRILTPTADDLAALGKVVALAESATDAEGVDYATPLAATLSERQALRAKVESLRAKLDSAGRALAVMQNHEIRADQAEAKLAAAEQQRDDLRLIATEAVDAIGSGHSEHWDPTMSYGAGCAACNRERGLRGRLRSALAAAEQEEPKRDLLAGYVPAEDTTPEITDVIARSADKWMDDEPKREQS